MFKIGIDIGSTYTKYCVMDDKNKIINLFTEKTPIKQKEYFEKKQEDLKKQYCNPVIMSCGYGKNNVLADKRMNELVSLAKGSNYLYSRDHIILDIGGQDTKIICQKDGKLTKFFINDKCAAGSGMFLANGCRMLEKEFEEISLIGVGKPDVKLSSVCAVFAQSEIVELLADNIDEDKIIRAIIWQILVQAKSLLKNVDNSEVLLSGGLTKIKGFQEYAQLVFDRRCNVIENGSYMSSIGCCI